MIMTICVRGLPTGCGGRVTCGGNEVGRVPPCALEPPRSMTAGGAPGILPSTVAWMELTSEPQ